MLAGSVASDVRNRGDAYFKQGRVGGAVTEPERMSAEVKGNGDSYRVSIDMEFDEPRRRATVSAVCGCPYFLGGAGYCKHIWAVLCFADAEPEGRFKARPGFRVGLRKLAVTKARTRAVVSVDPGALGRVRGFSPIGGRPVPTVESPGKKSRHPGKSGRALMSWREAIKVAERAHRDFQETQSRATAGSGNEIHYVIDLDAMPRLGQLAVQVFRLTAGDVESPSGRLVAAPVDPKTLDLLALGPDRDILGHLFGVVPSSIVRPGQWSEDVIALRTRVASFAVADSVRTNLLGRMAATGRFGWLDVGDAKLEEKGYFPADGFRPLPLDDAGLFQLVVGVSEIRQGQAWELRGELRRGDERISMSDAVAQFNDGWVILRDRVVRTDTSAVSTGAWLRALRESGGIEVSRPDQAAFLQTFVDLPGAPGLDLPPGAGWKIVTGVPRPRLIFQSAVDTPVVLMANYDFGYQSPKEMQEQHLQSESRETPANGEQDAVEVQARVRPLYPTRFVVRPDRDKEAALVRELCAHPSVHMTAGRGVAGADLFVDAAGLSELAKDLSDKGWSVEAEGQRLRVGRSFQVDVRTSSGMDWLNLRALFDFGDGKQVALPKLLEAMQSGQSRIVLDDGSVGMLPEEWLDKLLPILKMGKSEGSDALQFQGNQAAFLDVLVEGAAVAQVDETFQAFRQKIANLSGVHEIGPAQSFVGELRPYQRQGLGWLEFLDETGLGGCLADDMGLGKTVQVLAHLQRRQISREERGETKKPTLIVAPTSLVHNWADEAKRFVPELKVHLHVGASRSQNARSLARYDLVITSYGTMRSDIEWLAKMTFDYVVLDEAQAIKNEGTQVAQAARALKARRKLAMSGTPVENRLAELGSLFKFLNPEVLEASTGFSELFSNSGKLGAGQLKSLARMLRPFILRRTKEQVLPELPGKTESTIYCHLEDDRRREYDELAAFYRDSLAKRIKTEGLGKSRMHILEALLRLRQLACHPGLIDQGRVHEPSAKLDLLEEQLDEVMSSGRKALVFSQFTSMLAIVRARLDEKGIVYEYLDGSTTDRKARVEKFQTDDSVRVFLISLKAGGVGLNLTAADYCFILDPWWNPAAEAQAIDRAHRIGQKSHVFAYRLIARDTVEEKIQAMQAEKRHLVEGIISEDGPDIGNLTAKDLDFLLK